MKNYKKLLALALTGLITFNNKQVYANNLLTTKTIENIKYDQIEIVRAIDNVNIREGTDINSKKLGLLKCGDYLSFIGEDNEFYKVIFNDEYAYISKDYANKETINKFYKKPIKYVEIIRDTKLVLNDDNIDISKYEIAEVYKDENDKYLVSIDNNIGYINVSDTEEISNIFVVVDISSQTLKLYENNSVILESPVVTGKPSTPTDIGDFKIYSITHNRYLVGPGYKSYVDVMMKYNKNEGLHDAEYHKDYDENGNVVKSHGWRDLSEFGGETYINNGSHGCVNMPHDKAIEVSKHVSIGTRVLVKK